MHLWSLRTLWSLFMSLLGLAAAKAPLPHVAQPESEFGTEVSVKGFWVNKYVPSKGFLGVVSPEEDCAENLLCGDCNSHLGKRFKVLPHS